MFYSRLTLTETLWTEKPPPRTEIPLDRDPPNWTEIPPPIPTGMHFCLYPVVFLSTKYSFA